MEPIEAFQFIADCIFFERHAAEIRDRYGERTYVAICGQQILGSDPDKFRLAVRIRHREKPILITSVQEYRMDGAYAQ